MLLYNITFIVDNIIADEWLQWMKNTEIPHALQSGLIKSYKILKVLNSPNEGETYCIQYELAGWKEHDMYQQMHAAASLQKLQDLFGEQQVSFSSTMQILES